MRSQQFPAYLFTLLLIAAACTLSGTPASGTGPLPTNVAITLGERKAVFTLGQDDMKYVPDMHLGLVQEPDSSYLFFIQGIIGTSDSANGSTGLLRATAALDSIWPAVGDTAHAIPVLTPSCRDTFPAACATNFDAGYAGANNLWRAANRHDLLAIYHGETRTFGTHTNTHTPAFAVIGLARSADEGRSWTRMGPILSGYDPKAASKPKKDMTGTPEPGSIVAGDSIFCFFPYFPSADSSDVGPSSIELARAPLPGDAAPGTWTKLYNGSFGSEPGLGGRGSPVVPAVAGCTNPRQPWVAWSTYLREYVLFYVCMEGWFFTTSADLEHWTAPTQYYAAPAGDTLFTPGLPNEDNLVFVTPGNPPQVIGQTGLLLFAHTPSFGYGTGGSVSHELWKRPFSFSATLTAVGDGPRTASSISIAPNPFRAGTRVKFTLLDGGPVDIGVFDVSGRRVRTLAHGLISAGPHAFAWNGADDRDAALPAGMYFVRLRAPGSSLAARVARLR